MKLRFLNAVLLGLLLVAGTPSLAADKKPARIESGRVRPFQTGDTVPLANGGTGATTQSGAANAVLPTQTGHSGEFLTTNGSATSWAASGGGTAITVKDEGSNLTTSLTSIDCVGAGVTCTNSTGAVTMTITGSGAAMTLITETVTSGSQANVTFSSIPGTYRDLVVVTRGRGTTAATSTNLKLQFNADTGANYDYQYVLGIGATASSAVGSGQTFILMGDLVAASGTASFASAMETIIFDYRGTTFNKVVASTPAAKWANTSGSAEAGAVSGFWRSSSAITDIKVFPAAGNFVDGSVVSLYGRL